MITITFNAFSFLQKKFKKLNLPYANAELMVKEKSTPSDLLKSFKIKRMEVEAVFVNGKVVDFDMVLKDQDRVALVPPGTPGPYRVWLGMVKKNRSTGA